MAAVRDFNSKKTAAFAKISQSGSFLFLRKLPGQVFYPDIFLKMNHDPWNFSYLIQAGTGQ